MAATTTVLDDGNMDDINEEQEPEQDEQDEPTEPVETAELAHDGVPEDGVPEDGVPEEPMFEEERAFDSTPPPVPPAPQPVTQQDRLTRDPFATFGGVLSGIAHRYGWDVSLTRLAFVVLLIVSGGTALVAYLLAWLIIPRAAHWPPPLVGASRSRLSGRDLGIGLIGLGALVVLGIGSGEAAAVLVPLALVGGGIWLLVQNPRDEGVLAPTPAAALATSTPVTGDPAPAVALHPTVAPTPVPKRSRLRRFVIVGVFAFLGLALLLVIAIPVIFFAVITDGDFDFDTDAKYEYRPANIEEIQGVINENAGEIRLDLRDVDFDSIDRSDSPVRIDIDLDVGRIEVLLPEDVRISVDAEADLGDVTVLGSNDDGIKPSRQVIVDDPQLDLELDLNLGEIVVTQANTSAATLTDVN